MAPEVLRLPTAVVGRVDVGRLRRELENLSEFLDQAAVRQPGTPLKLPRSSRLLEDMARDNKLNLLEADNRTRLAAFLDDLKTSAPTIHMSFASDPSAAFVNKIVTWLRQEIHPLLLVQIGLQPSIAAGTVVRTANRYFDFSLRQYFAKQRGLLIEKISGETTQ